MQGTCFGIDWDEVRKRPDAQAVVDEILTDDIDDYSTAPLDGLWRSDSYMQHFDATEEREALEGTRNGPTAQP